jgi:polyphosphate kinase
MPVYLQQGNVSVSEQANQPNPISLDNPALYNNREISLLEFNRRVLNEAINADNPLLERLRFLSIFSNNLDEFFMVRVSGLKDQESSGMAVDPTPDGLSPQQQLALIQERVTPMLTEQRHIFYDQLVPELAKHNVYIFEYDALAEADKTALRHYFETEIFPILTPLGVDPSRPFPHISNLSLNLAILMTDHKGRERFARLKVPSLIPRAVSLTYVRRTYGGGATTDDGHHFIWLEEVIKAHLGSLFPGMKITVASSFRVTRNTDLEIAEEEAGDLLETIQDVVRQRRFGPVVRLDLEEATPPRVRDLLLNNLEVTANDIYVLRPPLGMKDIGDLANLDLPNLRFPPFTPVRPSALPHGVNIFNAIRQGDILMHHPYDSFSPTIEFYQQAANDPDVLAIKTTLYRVGRNSPIVEALLEAQENEKQVAVLVELKARFDEENNIIWARQLESAGVHVVYGLIGLKTHAKVSLVVRREGDGMRRYMHLSTGNYNASTARIYTDLALFTCDPVIGADASLLFNRLTGYANSSSYRKLLVAPEYLRAGIESRIRREIAHAQAGRPARMIFKMNSFVDPHMISLLYEASMAGVQIDLLVRGICCLKPGIPGVSENIRVHALIGRFLEHPRIFYFFNDGQEELFCGSADLMQRNLNRRVEVVFPVESATLRKRILEEILNIELRDNNRAYSLNSDGSYTRLRPDDDMLPLEAQRWLMERARGRQ